MNEYKGCPGCGEMEDKDCRCTGEDYDRFTWKPGDVEVKPAGFEWKIPFDSADYLEGGIEYQAEVAAEGSLPNPLETITDRLREEVDGAARQTRKNPTDEFWTGQQCALLLAMHIVAQVQAEIDAIRAEHVPGRVY